MNNNDNLVKMVNQIGTFFESMPDRNEALEGIANHLKKFWDPRMRKALIAMIDDQEHSGVKEIVLNAIETHREMLRVTEPS